MTLREAGHWIIATLEDRYDDREAAAIGALVMENITGLDRSDRAVRKTETLTGPQAETLRQYCDQLGAGRPVQYVLGEAWFRGLRFFVDERVLIPRPETEELIDWVLNEPHGTGAELLDLGTGSGCIPCCLKRSRPDLWLRACDVSPEALDVAKKNSAALSTPVDFFVADLLDENCWPALGRPDIVISNPPYIPLADKHTLDRHVAGFEPGLALFVPGDDPLLFYKKIAEWVSRNLPPGRPLFVELHHDYAMAAAAWFTGAGFRVELRKDFSGNNRMMRAVFG